MLKLVSSVPDFFAHRGAGGVIEGKGFGCSCAKCARDVSAPFGYERSLIWCLYCGMEEGHVPMVEQPFGYRYSFGVTREECNEDKKALNDGNFEEVAFARAKREGRIVELFG